MNINAETYCFEAEEIFIYLAEGKKCSGLGIKYVIKETMRVVKL